jgi:hypothetical protein
MHAIPQLSDAMSSSQIVALLIVGMGAGFLVLVSLAGIIVPALAGVLKHRMDALLREKMVDRGFSADEIVRVLSTGTASPDSVSLPCASEVVVECDGDWQPAFVLKHQDHRYYVHLVGHDVSENQWIAEDRIRFPAGSKVQSGSLWDFGVPGSFTDPAHWCAKSKAKPAPVDGELA